MGFKNIALITKPFNTSEVDAAVTTIITLAQQLQKKGHNPIIITGRGYKKYWGISRTKHFEKYRGIKIYRPYFIPWIRTRQIFLDPTLFFNILIAPVLAIRYVQKKEKIKFDILHTFGGSPIFALTPTLIKLFYSNSKIVHTIKSKSPRFASKFFYKLLNSADIITVPAKSIKKKLINQNVFSKIKIINSFIDFSKFKVYNKKSMRDELKLNLKSKIILYYGQFGEQKGVDVLLDAFNIIRNEIPDSQLILVHPTYPLGKIKKKLQVELKKDRITYVEGRINVSKYLSASDVLVLPYTNMNNTEITPLCILESICCRTPIITSDFPELFEIFEKNKDILSCKPNNFIELSKKIKFLLTNQKVKTRLINNSIKKLPNFDSIRIANELDKEYSQLVSNNRKI